MSAAAMTERISEASPRFKARIAGVFYLLNFLTGGLGIAPTNAPREDLKGLQVYFSLVPRPEPTSPYNYAGIGLTSCKPFGHGLWRACWQVA